MQCHVCGTEVRPEHKFCMECGARLHGASTSQLALAPPRPSSRSDVETTALPPAAGHSSASPGHPMFDPVTGQLLAVAARHEEDATNVLPALGEPVNTLGFAPPDPDALGPGHWERTPDHSPRSWPESQNAWPGSQLGPPSYGYDRQVEEPTRQQYTAQPPYRVEPPSANYSATTQMPAAYEPWPDEDVTVARSPAFRIRPLLILAILGGAAAIVGMFVRVVNIVPAAPTGADPFGAWKLNDFGTNLTVTGILVVLTMILGALAWCGGYRWGAGLAGGAGAALAGFALLVLGLAEIPLSQASAASISAESTRDVGYWCLAGAGAGGLIVLFTSLLRAGNDRRAGLDPWVGALGALATIAAVIGPLIPLNDADLDLNWSTPTGSTVDLPTLYFVGRFVQLGLLLLCGVFGFLLVRRYGLGLAIGGTIGVGWMVLTAATEQTDFPIGPAVANPGAEGIVVLGIVYGKPYIVTIVGIGLMVFFGLVAAAMALIDAD